MSNTTKLALTLLLAALLLGVIGDVLLRPLPWGINLLLWVGALAFGVGAVARWRNIRLTGGGRWMIVPVLVFAAMFAWRDSLMLYFYNLSAILIALALAAYRALRGRIRIATVADYARGLVLAGLYAAFGIFPLIFEDIKWRQVTIGRHAGKLIAVGTGLLIAVPVLFIFGGLLTSADAVFAKLISDLFSWDPYQVFSHLFWITFWAWIVAGFLRQLFLAKENALAATSFFKPSFGMVEISIVLGSLIVLFFGFVAVQFRYLFGGVEALRSIVHLSYAEYARRGFFELVAVAALTLPLLLFAHWLIKKDNPNNERGFRVLAGLLIGLLFVIMISALYRMRLYQVEFGLTELRVYTTAFMGWLALVFMWFILTVLRGKYDRFVFGALAAGFAVLFGLNILNPDDFIVRVNAGRVNTANGFDASYVAGLSADAVPALIEAMPHMTEQDRCTTAAQVLRRWSQPENIDLLTWNWDRVQAWQAVSAAQAYLQQVTCSTGRD